MPKKILIINGHHKEESFNSAICDVYEKASKSKGAEIYRINLSSLAFDSFKTEFPGDNEREDILNARQKIKWADHIVWIFPVWWYSMPSKLKAFVENVFVSGFAFKYKDSTKFVQWDKYLSGKSSHIISTLDGPPWYYKLLIGQPSFKSLKYSMTFCGIKPVKGTHFGSIKLSNKKQREKWLRKVERIAIKSVS